MVTKPGIQKTVLIIILSLLPVITRSQLVINEIMSNNVSYIMDDAYNFSMWVEIYNSSTDNDIDISDYFFTDNFNEPEMWKPGSAMVPAQGYLVLWFERAEREGHSSFKLEPKGGMLYMIDKSHKIADQVMYPDQCRNISYGRKSDGSAYWVFFEEPSPGFSNANKRWSFYRCSDPVFNLKNGFYSSPQDLTFKTPPDGETIYYSLNNTEPDLNAIKYVNGNIISIDTTVVVRAKSYKDGKLSSNVVSSTFFINERMPGLRVISISTNQEYLSDDTIGIYCDGKNGITGNLQKTPKNFNQDWDRPVNFEFFDETGQPCLNQELDIRIVGGGSRESDLKSISISPKKKYGDNKLRYDFFKTHKPGHNYKDILMRNSGNDFKRTMMKDAFLQSIIIDRMDVDYQAYEPAVIYINGVYYGIENMRERANKSFVYSNFGMDDDDIYMIEATYKGVDSHNDMPTDPEFIKLSAFLKENSMVSDVNYQKACELIDVNEFINYLILETFCANVDWPYNNVKMWKKTIDGTWRWLLLDVEYSYSMGRINHNSITFALGENTKSLIGGYSTAPEWSTIVFSELIKNENFKNSFIDRYCIHLSTTFQSQRLIHIIDSMADRIRNEIPYHLARFNIVDNFQNDINVFKDFSNQRQANVLNHISERFLNSAEVQYIDIKSNVPGANYKFNNEIIIDPEINLSYFKGRDVSLEAIPVKNCRFKHWLLNGDVYPEKIYTGKMNGDTELTAVYEENIIDNENKFIFINELVTSNQTIIDEYGETDDYIELYNNSSDDINITGWYLTDNPDNKTLYKIPSGFYAETILKSNSWLVLWADDQTNQGALHLNFKLNRLGEAVWLYKMTEDSALHLIDSVTTPLLNSDLSFSRFPDGGPMWKTQGPTCNFSNLETAVPVLREMQTLIYPTIIYASFHVDNAKGLTLAVIDLNGRIHFKKEIAEDHEIINIEKLNKGMYIILIGKNAVKVIKQ